MTCEHPRKWEMKSCYSDDINKLLELGFEPYHVKPAGGDLGNAYFFKRLKPCEECKKV